MMFTATWLLFIIIIISTHFKASGTVPLSIAENDTYDENSFEFLLTSGLKVKKDNVHRTHIVSIRTSNYVEHWGDNHFCAGVIISRRLVITAAHCVVESLSKVKVHPTRIKVIVGTLKRLEKTESTLELSVKEILVHNHYTRGIENDIGLLRLNEDMPKSYHAVAHVKISKNEPKPNESCFALGWGLIYPNGPYSDDLLYLNIKISDHEMCKKIVKDYNPAHSFCGFHESIDEDACPGDYGGPLICNNTLSGIISGSSAMCDNVGPVEFTNVIYYLDWIDQARDTGIREIATNSYLLILTLTLIVMK